MDPAKLKSACRRSKTKFKKDWAPVDTSWHPSFSRVSLIAHGNQVVPGDGLLALRRANMENVACHSLQIAGGNVKRDFLMLGITVLAVASALAAQAPESKAPKSKSSNDAKASPAAVSRGKETFEKRCAVCHYADSDAKKIGPGLKGLSKRGSFTVNNNKVTDETLKTWIENGDSLMPPFKEQLTPSEIKDVIAYVKTL